MAINKVGSKGIEDGAVAAIDLADNTISSDKFANTTIANAKLSNSSITASGVSASLGASVNINNQFVDWQSVITSDGSTVTTMVAGKGYFVDNTSAAGLVKLPASASRGDIVAIKDYAGNFGTNNLTIQRNSHKIQGFAGDSTIQTDKASLVLVYVDATKGWLYWEESNVGDLTPAFIEATGGTVTTSGNFKIHEFTGDGNFVVSQVGNAPGAPAGGPSNVDYLVVAGGGGGGSGYASGGGGAGGYRTTFPSPNCNAGSFSVSAQTYPITVGAGGTVTCGPDGSNGNGGRGSNSIFSTITSTGGGGGRGGAGTGGTSCMPGGSGGGAGNDTTGTPSFGTGNTPPVSPSQGNPGAASGGPDASDRNGGGGGGGASAAGTAGVVNCKGGDGGDGLLNQIDGLDNAGAFNDRSPNAFGVQESGAIQESTITNFNNTSMFFDGSGDKLTTDENSAFTRGTGDWTLEFFIYKIKSQTNQSIVMQQDTSGGTNGFQVEFTSSKVTLYNYELDNNWTIRAQENSAASTGSWNHYAFVRASNVHTLYKNGVAQTTTTTNSGSHAPQYEGLIWGAHRSDSGRFLTGYLDNLRFSSTARYTSNFTTPTTNFTTDSNTIFLCQSDNNSRQFAGGGQGGGRQSPMTAGFGGSGGGGLGSLGAGTGVAGTANLGGGGGGGGKSSIPAVGGTGGKGIVIIRYKFQ